MAKTTNTAPTKVKDLMTPDPVIISPETTLKEAAQKMAEIGCGVLPVGTHEKIEGIITDRDIVIRAVAKGKDMSNEIVGDYMTSDVHACAHEATADEAASMMGENNISRVMVEDEEGRPCGILTFGRIIRENGNMREIASVIACAVGEKDAA